MSPPGASPPPGPDRPSVRSRFAEEGVARVGRSYLSDRWDGFLRRLAHRHVAPRVSEIYRQSSLQTVDPVRIALALPGLSTDRWEAFRSEHAAVADRLRARYTVDLPYPTASAFSSAESELTYAMVRWLGPADVWETGVANGHSSFVLLSALAANGRGRLTSLDVRPDVGRLVPAELRGAWNLRILSRRHPDRDLREAFAQAPAIDLFIHDSDHSYAWQMSEYRQAWAHLSPRGILASDDVDWSYAFWDFAREVGRRPLTLVSENKLFALLPPP